MAAILAIETSTLTASVAVLAGDLVVRRESGVNTHSEDLLRLVDEALAEAGVALGGLDTIAIGAGPGSFTGLRIGMATAKGLCFATGVSLTPVSSLAALAVDGAEVRAPGGELWVPVLDARRREVFAGFFVFEGGVPIELSPERVLAPAELPAVIAEIAAGREVVLCGDGMAKYRELLAGAGVELSDARLTPSAAAVARLAIGTDAALVLASATPAYVRRPEAEIKFPDGNPGGTFSTRRPSS